jgi:hypothetical protein
LALPPAFIVISIAVALISATGQERAFRMTGATDSKLA